MSLLAGSSHQIQHALRELPGPPVDKTVGKEANFSSKTVPFLKQYPVQPYQQETVQPLTVDKTEISNSLSQGHRW